MTDIVSILVLSSGTENFDWVLRLVSFVRQVVGVSCEGHEEKLMSLFTSLEREIFQNGSKTSCKSVGRGLRELKGLSSTVNYEGKTRKEGRDSQKLL